MKGYICLIIKSGRIKDFRLGGRGTQKIMCAYAHHEREERCPICPYVRLYIRTLEALGFLMLTQAKWALFLSIPIQQVCAINISLGGTHLRESKHNKKSNSPLIKVA